MSDGIHIPAFVVRLAVVAAVLAIAALVKIQMPEARRYVKMERM